MFCRRQNTTKQTKTSTNKTSSSLIDKKKPIMDEFFAEV